MSVEFPTPSSDEHTYRVPYEEVATIEEAVAWIRRPPFPPETLKKLKKGVLLTARVRAEWVQENGQHGEEIATMGLVLRAGTRNFPTKIAVVTRDVATIDGEPVGAKGLGLRVATARRVAVWFRSGRVTSAQELLAECDGVTSQLLTLTACALTRAVLHVVPVDESRPRNAIEAAEAWLYGHGTLAAVVTAKSAVAALRINTVGGVAADAGPAAWAATAATWAAMMADGSIAATVYAASQTASAAWTATRATAGTKHAKIVREWIGLPEVIFAAITRKT